MSPLFRYCDIYSRKSNWLRDTLYTYHCNVSQAWTYAVAYYEHVVILNCRENSTQLYIYKYVSSLA